MLSSVISKSINTKQPKWAIGDPQSTAGSLGANFVNDSATSITLDTPAFEGDVIRFMDSSGNEAIVRLTGDTNSSYVANMTIEKEATGITFASGTRYDFISSSAKHDGIARGYITQYATTLYNNMQRTRESAGIGRAEAGSESYLVDMSFQRQVKLAVENSQIKMNKALYFNSITRAPSSSSDTGIAGGFPYFTNVMKTNPSA